MKKIVVCLLIFYCSISLCAYASKHTCSSKCAHHSAQQHSSSSGSSTPVYLVKSEHSTTEQKFPNCEKHYVVVETTINYFSDGTKRVHTNNTIYNKDGSVLVSDCSHVNHILYNNNHYFIIAKNRGGYSIIDSTGNSVTKKSYSRIEEVNENRFLVKYDKKYGIIDIAEKVIVPIKYQKFQQISKGIYISKLNGYYGIIDTNNKILVKNDCERMKPLYDTVIIKRYGKFGLADSQGKILYEAKYDKIKKLDEYIIIKKGNILRLLDSKGQQISNEDFKKIELKRNTLYGYTTDNRIIRPTENN